jgi:phosphinothricin acetyltransferase
MRIRHARPGDLQSVVDIYNSTIASRQVTADLEPASPESKSQWFHAHHPASFPLWIAEKDETIIAWMSLEPFKTRAAYRHTAEVSIYIHPDYRQKGLGVILLQYVIDQCPALQIKTLLGYIFGHNTPSIRLFEKFGFTTWAHFPRIAELDGVERDLVILGKRIG